MKIGDVCLGWCDKCQSYTDQTTLELTPCDIPKGSAMETSQCNDCGYKDTTNLLNPNGYIDESHFSDEGD